MGGVGAADFRKGAPGEAVRILRGADLTHCILICGVIRRAEAQVGQEQQASWRLVIYICMALQIRGPGIVWAVRALDNTVLQDRPAELLRLPGKVAVCFRIQGGQRAKRLPYQHIVIGQVGVAAHVIGGLKEGLVECDRPVPFGAQGAQNIRKPGADRVVLQTVPVACGTHIALQGQHRGHQFIQLKTRLQDCAVDVPRVDAQVAPLTAEYIVQHPAGQCRVGVHYRIMQFHSEKANPSPSEERSPWNVQERTGDDTIIPTFRYYVNTRMNILPYIYSEAQQCTEDGTPLMRAMMIDFPEDPEAYDLEEQYMFGRSLLVAPVLEEGQTVKEIYLPEGEWIDFFHNALTAGGGTKNYYCDVDSIPVYVRNGSIIPLNLNEDYELGGSIGNDVDNYTNLTFRVYPKGDSSYTLVHSDRSTITVNASEDFKNGSVSVSIPAAAIPVTTQVFGTEPTGVTVNGQAIQRAATLDEFQAAQTAYYYSGSEKLVYIKTAAGDASEIEIEGIYQAPYEAEHAEQANVAVNTDHEGYYGEGFVDQFASEGCAVTFTVNSDGDTALLDVRYSAGTEAAQRTLLVNGESIVLDLPKTQDWDSWNTVSVPVELVSGQNTITISYQAGNFAGINLDCISLRNQ